MNLQQVVIRLRYDSKFILEVSSSNFVYRALPPLCEIQIQMDFQARQLETLELLAVLSTHVLVFSFPMTLGLIPPMLHFCLERLVFVVPLRHQDHHQCGIRCQIQNKKVKLLQNMWSLKQLQTGHGRGVDRTDDLDLWCLISLPGGYLSCATLFVGAGSAGIDFLSCILQMYFADFIAWSYLQLVALEEW